MTIRIAAERERLERLYIAERGMSDAPKCRRLDERIAAIRESSDQELAVRLRMIVSVGFTPSPEMVGRPLVVSFLRGARGEVTDAIVCLDGQPRPVAHLWATCDATDPLRVTRVFTKSPGHAFRDVGDSRPPASNKKRDTAAIVEAFLREFLSKQLAA